MLIHPLRFRNLSVCLVAIPSPKPTILVTKYILAYSLDPETQVLDKCICVLYLAGGIEESSVHA